ncbi:hypothetical protein [Pedococcus sp. 5OH_020]|uniref:hypothetical protein n=1 Tax=Pedococcus sp. 5OH_020 TaxID=2989814 RepID=UPI0022E9E691|nr:hypothetical protein [Pedococcus sp. 5OH_020]
MSRMRFSLGSVTGGSFFGRLLIAVGLDGAIVRMDDTFTPEAAAMVYDAVSCRRQSRVSWEGSS